MAYTWYDLYLHVFLYMHTDFYLYINFSVHLYILVYHTFRTHYICMYSCICTQTCIIFSPMCTKYFCMAYTCMHCICMYSCACTQTCMDSKCALICCITYTWYVSYPHVFCICTQILYFLFTVHYYIFLYKHTRGMLYISVYIFLYMHTDIFICFNIQCALIFFV